MAFSVSAQNRRASFSFLLININEGLVLVEGGNKAYNNAMAHKTIFAAGLTSQVIERKLFSRQPL
jgi:hypothetical protein